jgi:hypothetical protein
LPFPPLLIQKESSHQANQYIFFDEFKKSRDQQTL